MCYPIQACAGRSIPLSIAVSLCLGGCVQYQRHDLVPRAELEALKARTLPEPGFIELVPANADAPQTAPFDPSDGLDDRELMAIAVTFNPELQAARAAIGESEALLIAAKTLPNPEIGVGFGLGLPGTDGFKLDTDLLLELLKPGERDARQGVATSRIAASKAAVFAKEYEIAAESRRRGFEVIVAEQTVVILDAELALRQQAADLIRSRKDAGEANNLDVYAVDLELAEIQRDKRLAVIEQEQARLTLNQSLGLPPHVRVPLQQSGHAIDVPLIDTAIGDDIDERLLQFRLDLKAREAMYEVSEGELRLATSRQFAKLKAGPLFSHEGDDANYAGISASIEIPIFDRNQGEIAEKTAARDHTRAEYVADLHRLRSEAAAVLARVQGLRQEIDTQNRETISLLERSQALYRSAFDARELSVLDWIAAQERALRTRRAYLDTIVSYRRALLDLEALTGFPTWRFAPPQIQPHQTSIEGSNPR